MGIGQYAKSARITLDTLTSSAFWGRGYTNGGMEKAARYLENRFNSIGLQPLTKNSFRQEFNYPVNTFPGAMEVNINGKVLMPGRDFIVSGESRSFKGRANLVAAEEGSFVDAGKRVLITVTEKLTWSVAEGAADYTKILVKKDALEQAPVQAIVHIDQQQVKAFKATNVVGMVKGTLRPDSFMVVTAHYDHLGGMGDKTFFPGANDNASGVSMLLELARHFVQNPPPYSVVFICFAGEEAGLIGSKYFTSNPLIPLQNIRFLTNIDLAGTGDEGITVVNATEFQQAFTLLNTINDSSKLLAKINARGKAANSDHYWFTEKGVPSFFIYTLGGIKAYHDVYDKAETLPLTAFDNLVTLLMRFSRRMMNPN